MTSIEKAAIVALFFLGTNPFSRGVHAALRSDGVATDEEPVLDDMNTGAEESELNYGLDVSFPIQHRVSTNYPWLPHNADPDNNEIPAKFADMPLQVLGNRQDVYTEHLDGCRTFYGDQARQCDVYEYDRMLMNMRQPQSMQNYTKAGFKKVRAPQQIIDLIKAFWDKNHLNQKQEVWPEGNTYTNHWRAPTYMVSVDDTKLRGSGGGLKRKIWEAARAPISEWTGEDISPTSMYGIRVYTEGAVLVPHVDRLPLVASCMVNVAQDVDEPWPMEIYSHDGRAHNVTLEPGDMLLFESHSIVHGRPFPLKGRYYAMLFIHFEPTGHSLRHNADFEVIDVDKQYKQASEDGVGGQSASGGALPPYIKRESPEEEHWRMLHPTGWQNPKSSWSSPASAPANRGGKGKTDESSKIHRAAAFGDVKTVEKEIKTAERKSSQKTEVLGSRDENGWQPIHEAAAGGHKKVMEVLANNGADINSRTHGGWGETPLYLAIKHKGENHPIVKYLKSMGALNVGPEL